MVYDFQKNFQTLKGWRRGERPRAREWSVICSKTLNGERRLHGMECVVYRVYLKMSMERKGCCVEDEGPRDQDLLFFLPIFHPQPLRILTTFGVTAAVSGTRRKMRLLWIA